MSHTLTERLRISIRDGLPCPEYTNAMELIDAIEHDVDAYRGALGYDVPGNHDGKLSDGTTPVCGICGAIRIHIDKVLKGFPDSKELRALGDLLT